MSETVVIFSPYTGGHHPEYVSHLVQGWKPFASGRRLMVALGAAGFREYETAHPAYADLRHAAVSVVAIPESQALGTGEMSLAEIGWWHRRALHSVCRTYAPSHLLLTHLDHAQVALATRVRLPGRPAVGGILFRPELHYRTRGFRGSRGRLHVLRKALLLGAALRHGLLKAVFSPDSEAVPSLTRLARRPIIKALPEPVLVPRPAQQRDVVLEQMGIDADRRMGLLFGALSERKGVRQLLDAANLLPRREAERLALVLAGNVDEPLRQVLPGYLARARSAGAQVVLLDHFIEAQQLDDLLAAADVILAPYQQHVGSSGVLVRAAVVGKPVITQSGGLLGRHVSRFGLGVTCDTGSPSELADALRRFVGDGIALNRATAAQFASLNSVEAFCETIWVNLLGPIRNGS
jgi:glycosyltransferase involved in cell wall biosynthesis